MVARTPNGGSAHPELPYAPAPSIRLIWLPTIKRWCYYVVYGTQSWSGCLSEDAQGGMSIGVVYDMLHVAEDRLQSE